MPGKPIYPNDGLSDAYERELLNTFLAPVYDALRQGIQEARDLDDLTDKALGNAFQPDLEDGVPDDQVDVSLRRIQREHDRQTRSTFRQAFGVDVTPIVRDRGEVEAFLRHAIAENVALIKTIPEALHGDLRRGLERIQLEGRFLDEQATTELVRRVGRSSGYRLRRIARDQNSKLTGQLTEIRHRQIGITHYKWSTSLDERVRPSHVRKEGRVFEWASPPEDTGHPGHDIQCRCAAVPIVTEPLKRREKEEDERADLPPQEELARYGYQLELDRALQAPPTDYEAMRSFFEAGYESALNDTPLVTGGHLGAGDLRSVFDQVDESWTNADLDAVADSRSWISLLFRGYVVLNATNATFDAFRSLDFTAQMWGVSRWVVFASMASAFVGSMVGGYAATPFRIGDVLVRLGKRYSEVVEGWDEAAAARAATRTERADYRPRPHMSPNTPVPEHVVPLDWTPRQRYDWIQNRIVEISHANRRYADEQLFELAANEFDKLFGRKRDWIGVPHRFAGDTEALWVKRRAGRWMELAGLDRAEALRKANLEWAQSRWTGWLPVGRLHVDTPPPRVRQAGETYDDWYANRARQLRRYNPDMTQRDALRWARGEAKLSLHYRFDPFVNAGRKLHRSEVPLPSRRFGRTKWMRAYARRVRLYNPEMSVRESFVAAQVEWRRADFAPPTPRPFSTTTKPSVWLRERAEELRRFDEERYGDGRARAQLELDAMTKNAEDTLGDRPDLGSIEDVSIHEAILKWQRRLFDQYEAELAAPMSMVEVELYVKYWWSRHGVGEAPTITFATPLDHGGIAEEIGDYEIVMWVRVGTEDQAEADAFRMTRGTLIPRLTSVLMSRLYTARNVADAPPAPRSKEFASLLARFYESDVVDPTLVRMDLGNLGLDLLDEVDLKWARRVARVAAMSEYQISRVAFESPKVRYLDDLAEFYDAARKRGPPDDAERVGVGVGVGADGGGSRFYSRVKPAVKESIAGDAPWSDVPPLDNPDTPAPPDFGGFLHGRRDWQWRDDLPGGFPHWPVGWVRERAQVIQRYNETMGKDAASKHAHAEWADLYSEVFVEHVPDDALRLLLTEAVPRAPAYQRVVDGQVRQLAGGALEVELARRAEVLRRDSPYLNADAARALAVHEHRRVLDGTITDVVDAGPLHSFDAGSSTRDEWVPAQVELLLKHDATLAAGDALATAHAQFSWLTDSVEVPGARWRKAQTQARPHRAYDEIGGADEESRYNRFQQLLFEHVVIVDYTLTEDEAIALVKRVWSSFGLKAPPRLVLRARDELEISGGVHGFHEDGVIHLLHDPSSAEPTTELSLLLHELGHALHARMTLATDAAPTARAADLTAAELAGSARMNHSPVYGAIMLRLFEAEAGLKLKRVRAKGDDLGWRRDTSRLNLTVDLKRRHRNYMTDEDKRLVDSYVVPNIELTEVRANAVRRGMNPDTLLDGVLEDPVIDYSLSADDAARLFGRRGGLASRGRIDARTLGADPYGDGYVTTHPFTSRWFFSQRERNASRYAFRDEDGDGIVFETMDEVNAALNKWVDLVTTPPHQSSEFDNKTREQLLRRAAIALSEESDIQSAWQRRGLGEVPFGPPFPPMVLPAALDPAYQRRLTSKGQDFGKVFSRTQYNDFLVRMMTRRLQHYAPWFHEFTAAEFVPKMMRDALEGRHPAVRLPAFTVLEDESFTDFARRRTAELRPALPYENDGTLRTWLTLEWNMVLGHRRTRGGPKTVFDQDRLARRPGHTGNWYSFEQGTAVIPERYITRAEAEELIERVWADIGIGGKFAIVWYASDDHTPIDDLLGFYDNNRLYLGHRHGESDFNVYESPAFVELMEEYGVSFDGPDWLNDVEWALEEAGKDITDFYTIDKGTVLHELTHLIHERLMLMTDEQRAFTKGTWPASGGKMIELGNHDAIFGGILLRLYDEYYGEGVTYERLLEAAARFNRNKAPVSRVFVADFVDSADWHVRQLRNAGVSEEALTESRGASMRSTITYPSEKTPAVPSSLTTQLLMSDADLDALRARIPDLEDEWTPRAPPGQDDTEMHPFWENALRIFGADEEGWPVPSFETGADAVEWVESFAEYIQSEYGAEPWARRARPIAVIWFAKHHSHKTTRDEVWNLRVPDITDIESQTDPLDIYAGPIEGWKNREGDPGWMSVDGVMLNQILNRRASQIFVAEHEVQERWRLPHSAIGKRLGLYDQDGDEIVFFDDDQIELAVDFALPNMPNVRQLGLVDFDPASTDFVNWMNDTYALLLELNPPHLVAGSQRRAHYIVRELFAQIIAPQLSVEELRRLITVRRVGLPAVDDIDEVWTARTAAQTAHEFHLKEADARRVVADIFDTSTRGREGKRLAQDEVHRDPRQQNWLYTVQDMVHLWRNRHEMHADDRWLTKSEAAAFVEMVWRETGIAAPVTLRISPFTAEQLENGFAGHAYAGEYIEMGYRRGWTPEGLSAEKRARGDADGGVYLSKSTLLHELTHTLVHRAFYSTNDNPLGVVDDTLQSVLEEASVNHSETFTSLLAHMRHRYYDGIDPDEFRALAAKVVNYKRRQQVRYFDGAAALDDPTIGESFERMGDLVFSDEVDSHLWARENAAKGGMAQSAIDGGVERRVVIEHIDAIDTDFGKRKGLFFHNRTDSDGQPFTIYGPSDDEWQTMRRLFDDYAEALRVSGVEVDAIEPEAFIEHVVSEVVPELPGVDEVKLRRTIENRFGSVVAHYMSVNRLRELVAPRVTWRMPLWSDANTAVFPGFDEWWVRTHEGRLLDAAPWLGSRARSLAVEDRVETTTWGTVAKGAEAPLDKMRRLYHPEWGYDLDFSLDKDWRPYNRSAVDSTYKLAEELKAKYPDINDKEARAVATGLYWRYRAGADTPTEAQRKRPGIDATLEGVNADDQRQRVYDAEKELIRLKYFDIQMAQSSGKITEWRGNPAQWVTLRKAAQYAREHNARKGVSRERELGGAPPRYMIRLGEPKEGIAGVSRVGANHIALIPNSVELRTNNRVRFHLGTVLHEADHALADKALPTRKHAHGMVFAGLRKASMRDMMGYDEARIDRVFEDHGVKVFQEAADPDWPRFVAGADEDARRLERVLEEPQFVIDDRLKGLIPEDELPENYVWANVPQLPDDFDPTSVDIKTQQIMSQRYREWIISDKKKRRGVAQAEVEVPSGLPPGPRAGETDNVATWKATATGDGLRLVWPAFDNTDVAGSRLARYAFEGIDTFSEDGASGAFSPPSVRRVVRPRKDGKLTIFDPAAPKDTAPDSRSDYIPGGRLLEWQERGGHAGEGVPALLNVETTLYPVTEATHQTAGKYPEWMMRVRRGADVDDVAPPTREEVRAEFTTDFVHREADDAAEAKSRGVVSDFVEMREAAKAGDALVFDELQIPTGTFVTPGDPLQPAASSAISSNRLGIEGNLELAPIHDIKLVAEYDDVWLSRYTGELADVPTEAMTDAEIVERFPNLVKVDRYRVWSIDPKLPYSKEQGNIEWINPRQLPSGAKADQAAIDERAMVLTYNYNFGLEKHQVPGATERLDPNTDNMALEIARQAKFDYYRRVAQAEYELIDSGFILRHRLPRAEPYDWPEELPPLRFSLLYDSRRPIWYPDGFPSPTVSNALEGVLKVDSWSVGTQGDNTIYKKGIKSASVRFYTILDGFKRLQRQLDEDGLYVKTERSPELPKGVALPLRDADYDKNRIRRFDHMLDARREYFELDMATENPFNYGELLLDEFETKKHYHADLESGFAQLAEDADDVAGELSPEELGDKLTWEPGVFPLIPHWSGGKHRAVVYVPDADGVPMPVEMFDSSGELLPLSDEARAGLARARKEAERQLKHKLDYQGLDTRTKLALPGDETNLSLGGQLAGVRWPDPDDRDWAQYYITTGYALRNRIRTQVMRVVDNRNEALVDGNPYEFGSFIVTTASRTGKDFHMYRGIRLPESYFDGKPQEVLDALASGSLIPSQAEGFANHMASQGPFASEMFGASTLMVIDVPSGSHASFLNYSEGEIILPYGTRLELVYEEKNVLVKDSLPDDPYQRARGFDFVQYLRVVPDELVGDGYDLDPSLNTLEAAAARLATLKEGLNPGYDWQWVETTEPVKLFSLEDEAALLDSEWRPYLQPHVNIELSTTDVYNDDTMAATFGGWASPAEALEHWPSTTSTPDTLVEIQVPEDVQLNFNSANGRWWTENEQTPALVVVKKLYGEKVPEWARELGATKYFIMEYKPEAQEGGYKRFQ